MTSHGVAVLGSTGSIGENTLDVLARHPDRYRVVALSASTRVEKMVAQCQRYAPVYAVMCDPAAATQLKAALGNAGVPTKVLSGADALETITALPEVASVVAGIVGAAGLKPTLAAVRAGKRVLLANKEPLVMCGDLFLAEARRSGAQLLPVDSEHNAIFQCMPNGYRTGESVASVRRILLTCSGGPFRATPAERLAHVTPAQACAHPNWTMGKKISVDSATLMNKGLELIEACRLFNVPPSRVEVVIHPQSIIHSLVDYADGSVLAQMGNPDMRTPIAHALAWPERIEAGVKPLDLIALSRLDFSAPDTDRFPCLALAYRAAEAGGTAPTVLNAANEIAVEAFLEGEIGFTDIPRIISNALDTLPAESDTSLERVLAEDQRARDAARESVAAVRKKVQTRSGARG